MNGALFWFTLAACVGCGLIAGVFFAFSVLVMNTLGRRPAAEGIAEMQAINAAAERPPFLGPFLGTAVLCGVLVVWAPLHGGDFAPHLIIGASAYLVGVFLLTMAYHVPRNIALDAVDPHGAEAERRWAGYVLGWTALNHVRAVAALAAAALLATALYVG
jgi:uncharacterized membrane protein